MKRMVLRFYKCMTLTELEAEKELLYWGCGNKVDYSGDCMHYSTKGTARYCTTCRRHLAEIKRCIKIKKEERIKNDEN